MTRICFHYIVLLSVKTFHIIGLIIIILLPGLDYVYIFVLISYLQILFYYSWATAASNSNDLNSGQRPLLSVPFFLISTYPSTVCPYFSYYLILPSCSSFSPLPFFCIHRVFILWIFYAIFLTGCSACLNLSFVITYRTSRCSYFF